ncbi:MAG: sugar phosphate isomerase/epimerase family protein [Armatimonadia bacterium]
MSSAAVKPETPRTLDLAHLVWDRAMTDFDTTYSEVAQAGFRAMVMTQRRAQFDMLVPEQAREAGRRLERLGLVVRGCHGVETQPCDLSVAEADAHAAMVTAHATLMENVAELGCRTYVVHLGAAPQDGNKEAAWGRVRKAVDELGTRAEALGVALALENGMQGYLATNDELLAFVAGYDHPAVGICYDSGHAHIMEGAATVLEALSQYVVTVHLHDNDGTADQHLVPGHGTIDWRPVAEALARCPRLIHAEIEAANCTQWPPTPEVYSQTELYARYLEILNLPGTGVSYR